LEDEPAEKDKTAVETGRATTSAQTEAQNKDIGVLGK
jgi:hypothetical protein